MKRQSVQALLTIAALLMGVGLLTFGIVHADDGNYYNFDYEDYWKEYREVGYPPNTRLPCNGYSEDTCTWAWKPWYEHKTDLPQMGAEQYTGRTVSGYALMFKGYEPRTNLHGGIFRRESVQPCRTYRFTMYSRSGLDMDHPAPNNARMRVGISPTGDYPDEIVLTDSRIDAITWSAPSNSKYAYENLSVEATAQGDTITVFTRANPDRSEHTFIYWDEGSFSEVSHTGDLVDPDALPGATGYIYDINVQSGTTNATISWHTGGNHTLGQVLYRRLDQETSPPETYTHTLYLPLIQGGTPPADWELTSVQDWIANHQIQLTGLTSQSTYEYVVVSYGYVNGSCQTLVSDRQQFTTQ
ncbi:MAG: hypothetical protein ACLFTI_04665 [Anaerolineales bacterium]